MTRTAIGTALLLSFRSDATIPTAWIDADDSSHVTSVPGHTELTKSISILIQKATDRFTNLVPAVFGMVARACDGVDRTRRVIFFVFGQYGA